MTMMMKAISVIYSMADHGVIMVLLGMIYLCIYYYNYVADSDHHVHLY